MEDQLLATSYIVNASKNNEAMQSRFDVDIPLKIMPVQVSIDMLGFPWASFGQMYFVDFETNSTIDNVYVVTGIKHSMTQGNFTTNLNLAYQESFGTFEAAAEILDKSLDIEEKSKLISNAQLGSTFTELKTNFLLLANKKISDNIIINLAFTSSKTNDFYNVTTNSTDSTSINILHSTKDKTSSTVRFSVNDAVAKAGNNIYSNYIINNGKFLYFQKAKALEVKIENNEIQSGNIFADAITVYVPFDSNVYRGKHVSVCHTMIKKTIADKEYYVYEPKVFLMKSLSENDGEKIKEELRQFFPDSRFVTEEKIKKIRAITASLIENMLREAYKDFKVPVREIPDKPVKTTLYSSSMTRRKVQAISGDSVARFNGQFISDEDITSQRKRASERISRSKKQKIQKLASNRSIIINNYGSTGGEVKTPKDQEILELSDYNNQVVTMNDLALRIMRYYYLTPVFNKKYHLKDEKKQMTPENTASIEEFYKKADIKDKNQKDILSRVFENSKRGIYDILYADKSLDATKSRNITILVNYTLFVYVKNSQETLLSLTGSVDNNNYSFIVEAGKSLEENTLAKVNSLLAEKTGTYNTSIDDDLKSVEHYINYIVKSLNEQIEGGYIYNKAFYVKEQNALLSACYPYIKSEFFTVDNKKIFNDNKEYKTLPNQRTANIFYIIKETKNSNSQNDYTLVKQGIYDSKIGHVVYSEENIESVIGINLNCVGKLTNEAIAEYKASNDTKIKYIVPSSKHFLKNHKASDYNVDEFNITGELFIKPSIEKQIEDWLKVSKLDSDTFYSRSYSNYRVNLFRNLVDFNITKDKKYEEAYKEIQKQIIASFQKKAEAKKKSSTLRKKK
jgi:hypothetical protein